MATLEKYKASKIRGSVPDSDHAAIKRTRDTQHEGSIQATESLEEQRIANHQERRIEAYVLHSVRHFDHKTLRHQKKVSADLKLFRSHDQAKLPFLHVFLKHADLRPKRQFAALQYLSNIISDHHPFFSRRGDFIDCTLKSACGKRAGEEFPQQASVVLCAASASNKGDENGYEKIIAAMLAAGTDVNQCNQDGLSPLMLAARAGCQDSVIDLLVQHGARLQDISREGKNSLLLACEGKAWLTAIALFQHMTNLSAEHTERAFLIALELHGAAFVRHVVTHKPDKRKTLLRKLTLSDIVTHQYGTEVINYFLDNQSPSEERIREAARIAQRQNKLDALYVLQSYLGIISLPELCEKGKSDLVQGFLCRNKNIEDYEFSAALEISVNAGNFSMLRNLLQACPRTKAIIAPALRRACEKESYGSLCVLLEVCGEELLSSFQHATHGTRCQHPLCLAMQKSNVAGARALLTKSQKPPNSCLEHCLRCACETGSTKMVNIIAKLNSDVLRSSRHVKHQDGCVHPLCVAIRMQHMAALDELMEGGASLSVSKTLFKADSGHSHEYHMLCEYGLKELVTQEAFTSTIHKLLPNYFNEISVSYGLNLACRHANTSAARLFVNKMENLGNQKSADVVNRGDMPPLHAALRCQSVELVDLLLHHRADPNITYDSETPLYVACRLENFELLSRLLSAGANPSASYADGKSPIALACERNYIDIVEELLANKANPDERVVRDDGTAHIIEQAHRDEHHEVVRLLLEYGADPSNLTGVDLLTACKLGYAERVRYLMQQQKKNSYTHKLLQQCAEHARSNGFPETALELGDAGCQLPAAAEPQPMHLEGNHSPDNAQSDHQTTAQQLWLYWDERDVSKVSQLIKEGCDVNTLNAAGRSLLQECLQIPVQPGLAAVICESPTLKKEVVNHRDINGKTALFFSLQCTTDKHDVSLFELLLKKGADIHAQDSLGRSVLHEWQMATDGSQRGPPLEKLLSYIDVNVRDHMGQTALHLAVLEKNYQKITALLKHGADPQAKDVNHMTPLEFAEDDPLHALTSGTPCEHHADSKKVITVTNRLVPHIQQMYCDNRRLNPTSRFHKYSGRVYYTWDDDQKQYRDKKATEQANRSEQGHHREQEHPTPQSPDTRFLNRNQKSSMKQEMKIFMETVINMLKDINACIEKEDPVLSFKPIMSGSCAEGTKVMAVDEADILCEFKHELWTNLTLSSVYVTDPALAHHSFVQLDSPSASNHPELFAGGTLSKKKLLEKFYSLIKKHFPIVLNKYNRLNVIHIQDAMTNLHSLACLEMVWHGDLLPCQKFSIDVVPAIAVKQDQLPDITRQALLHADIVQGLYVVPKTGTFDASQYDPAFRLSFSSTECDLFHAMPAALKQAYMLTKVIKHDCLVVDSIETGLCSYNLKTATFQSMATKFPSWKEMLAKARQRNEKEPKQRAAKPQDVMAYAQMILGHLHTNVSTKQQMSFFLRNCDLIAHTIDAHDDRQVLHILYCRALASDADSDAWKDLATFVVRHLAKAENQHMYKKEDIAALQDMGVPVQDLNRSSQKEMLIVSPPLKYKQMPVERLRDVSPSSKETQTTVEKSYSCTVGSSDKCFKIVMSSNGEFLAWAERSALRRFNIPQVKGYLREFLRPTLLSNINPDFVRAVTSSGDVLVQDDYSSPTIMTLEDKEVISWQSEGQLVGCIHDNPVYVLKEGRVVIGRPGGEQTLILPHKPEFTSEVSVCGIGDRVAVLDRMQRMLHIFYGTEHTFSERVWHSFLRKSDVAICCSESHIFVPYGREGKNEGIRLYTWDEERHQSWDGDELGLDRDERIRACNYRDGILQLATFHAHTDVISLLTLQVRRREVLRPPPRYEESRPPPRREESRPSPRSEESSGLISNLRRWVFE